MNWFVRPENEKTGQMLDELWERIQQRLRATCQTHQVFREDLGVWFLMVRSGEQCLSGRVDTWGMFAEDVEPEIEKTFNELKRLISEQNHESIEPPPSKAGEPEGQQGPPGSIPSDSPGK